MSEVIFVGSIVAKLPISKGYTVETWDFFKEKFNKQTKGDHLYFEVDLSTLGLEATLNVENFWVIRKVVEHEEYGGNMKVTLADIQEFKTLVESYVGKLEDKDISVQAYDWYNCSEEPIS